MGRSNAAIALLNQIDQGQQGHTRALAMLLLRLQRLTSQVSTRAIALLISLTIPWPTSALAANSAPICPAALPAEIERMTQRPVWRRSRWGILIQTQAAQPQTLYAREAQAYFIPASNTKLLTTAAVLLKLGPDWRFQTTIRQIGPEPGPVRLQLVGQGDPSLTDQGLQQMGQQLSQRGLQRIDQLILVDRSVPEEVINPTWEWEDVQAGYGAPVNQLIVNQNAIALQLVPQALGQPLKVVWEDPTEAQGWQVVNQSTTVATDAAEFVAVGRDLSQPILRVQGQLRVGSAAEPVAIAVTNPNQAFWRHLQRNWRTQQITVRQPIWQAQPESGGRIVATVASPPLIQLLNETNQESNNLYAEALVRSLADGSLTAGLTALQTILTAQGVNSQGYSLRDGSGLSRHNLVSPEALVQTLQAMARSSYAPLYRSSLAVGGSQGTLQYRFRDTPVAGLIQAKTGTLTGASALSGYLTLPNYRPLVFSILVNQSTASPTEMRQAIDEMILLLARLRPC